MRKDALIKKPIEFPSYDGKLKLRGSAFLPDNSSGPVPVIIMTHGMADAAARIEPFAEFFQKQGFGVILYDHRTFLPSDGGPYQEVDPIAHPAVLIETCAFRHGAKRTFDHAKM